MDNETREIEVMKIAAALTLARCVLSTSTMHILPEDAAKKVSTLFDGFITQVSQRLIQPSPSETV